MSIADEIIGTHYRYPDYFQVGRQKVGEYARAVQDDHPAHFQAAAAAELFDRLLAGLSSTREKNS